MELGMLFSNFLYILYYFDPRMTKSRSADMPGVISTYSKKGDDNVFIVLDKFIM